MSFDDEDDDKFIEKTLSKQMNRSGNAANQTKGKQMSFHPKELVKGRPTLTIEESEAITDLKNTQKMEADFRRRNNMQGYPLDEIKAEGNKLVIDEDKVNARKQHESELIKKMYEEDKKSARGVKHNVEGRTVLTK
jgi:hypothetical protein